MLWIAAVGISLALIVTAIGIWLGARHLIVPHRRPLEDRHYAVYATPPTTALRLSSLMLRPQTAMY